MSKSVSSAIDLRQVRYFLAVSEELHFGRAAERLHLTQPPLSQAIRRLEDELGVRLLNRTSRSVALTKAGRVFAQEARKLLATVHDAVEETRRAGGAGTTLRIGCVPALPLGRLLQYVQCLHAHEPSISIQVAHLFAHEQIELLHDRELDVAIIFDPGEQPELEKERLFEGEQMVAFLRSDHRLATKPVIRPAHLHRENLVTSSQQLNPVLYEQTLRRSAEAGYRFKAIEEAAGATWRDLLVAVTLGNGIALAPAWRQNGANDGEAVVHRALDPPLRMPATFVTWRRDTPPGRRATLETVRQLTRRLRVSGSTSATACGCP